MAFAIAGIVLLPILAVLLLAVVSTGADWAHLWSTTMPRYVLNSVIMMAGWARWRRFLGQAWHGSSCIAGSRCTDFCPQRFWRPWRYRPMSLLSRLWMCLNMQGQCSSALRDVFGWTNAQDYWFPQIRSRWAAILVLGFALYPYVYLFARDAFEDQGARPIDVARSLGKGPFAVFWQTCLPLARPAIVAGTAVVMMEVLGDFGTVDYFAIQTLTTGIFTQWLEAYNAGAAAQIAAMMMLAVLVLGIAERVSRRRQRFDSGTRGHMPVRPMPVTGFRGWAMTCIVSLPFLLGFCLPVGVMVGLARAERWIENQLWRDTLNTVSLGAITAALAVVGALLLYQGIRYARNPQVRVLMPVTTIGYATPGAVLALGIMVPLVPVDHWVADRLAGLTGTDPGLLLTGTGAALSLPISCGSSRLPKAPLKVVWGA